tara:strand:- start:293 stop:1051 length:759 start_codon:yes stop_codon:yes gene_type:complete
MVEIFILSIVQGITEFLPISSSSHLVIISEYLNFQNQSLSLDVSLHIGSFFAVLFYFKDEIFRFFENKDLFIKILISSLPVILAGYILVKFDLIDQIRNIKTIGWTTLIFGVLLYFADRFKTIKNMESGFSYKTAIFVGIFQVFSLIPGVSRSGVTITAARFLKFERVDSAKISFLMSIPTLAAISFFGIYNLIKSDDLHFSSINLLSVFLSFVFSLITIKYFLKYIKNFSLNIFIIYRILLGIIILFLSYL